MIVLVESTNRPPMNTAGTEGQNPNAWRAFSISLPLGSWSSSWISGLTPSSKKSLLTAWDMQHVLLLNITTALCWANLETLSIGWLKQISSEKLKREKEGNNWMQTKYYLFSKRLLFHKTSEVWWRMKKKSAILTILRDWDFDCDEYHAHGPQIYRGRKGGGYIFLIITLKREF